MKVTEGSIRSDSMSLHDYNELPFCLCGSCGKKVTINQNTKKPNKYIRGHNGKEHGGLSMKGKTPWNKGKPLSENHKLNLHLSHVGQPGSNKGKKFSIESKEKMSKSATGRKNTLEQNQKIGNANKGKIISPESIKQSSDSRRGKKRTSDQRLKMSISAINYIENHKLNGKSVFCNIGKNENLIINQIENNIDIKGTSNNKNLFLKCGKWPDRYYEEYNLCVDVLENHHFKITGELSNNDQNRELDISSRVGCILYYIPEQEFLKDPEKEIQRFKNFLLLLDQGRN